MHRIAKFHFVSPGQFLTAMQEGYPSVYGSTDQGNV